MASGCDIDARRLQSYRDEELGRRERGRLKRHLEACPACRERLAAMDLGAELLRDHLTQAAERADFSGFSERVLAAIERQRPLPLGQRLWLWLRESWVHHRGVWLASAAGAAAVAILLIALLPGRLRPPATLAPPATPAASPGPQAARTASVDNEVIIDSLEYTGKRSMIFTVSKNNTTVIWMYDFDKAGAKDSQGDEL